MGNVPQRLQRAALDELDASVVIADSKGVIRYTNRSWREFCVENGGPRDGYLGDPYMPSSSVALDPELGALAGSLDLLLRGELDQFKHEYPCDAPGERRWFIMKARRIVDGDEAWAVILHVQVGASQLDEAELMRAGGLREYDALKDRLLRLIGHQFRTPLTPIQMDVRALAGLLDGKPKQIAQRVARNANRLQRTVETSLDLMKLEQRDAIRRQPRLAMLSLAQAVKAAGRRFGCLDRIHIKQVGEDTPMAMDLAWMGRAVAELIDNAARYGDDINIRMERTDDGVRFTVTDDGSGFREGAVSFARFEVDDETANTTSRTGLGLSLVKAVVEAHEGTIQAHSEGAGKGAEFQIELPIDPGEGTRSRPSRPRLSRRTAPRTA